MTALRRIGAGVVAIALFGVAMWLNAIMPGMDARQQDPLPNHGRTGQVVKNSEFSVRVDRLDVARTIVKPGLGKDQTSMTSPGVFVVVYLSAQAAKEPTGLGNLRLSTRDRLRYAPSGRMTVMSSEADSLQPLIWKHASYIFEIPRDQLVGAHLVVGQANPLNSLSGEADVDLRLDDKTARGLLAHPSDAYQIRES